MTGLCLGCIADDLTGATDLANELQRQGLRTILFFGPPEAPEEASGVEAAVIALKSRTEPADQAVMGSLKAIESLRAIPCRRFYFKYCSTFDSTDRGNIGPVADALLESLGEEFTIASPAFPRNRRTVYQGHLFVGGKPLAESSMRHHPLTPMTDSNLVRVLGRQTQGLVGLVSYETVRRGERAIREALAERRAQSVRFAIVDAVTDEDLTQIGRAVLDYPLTTGASGVAAGLARAILSREPDRVAKGDASLRSGGGPCVVLAGSCSAATLAQIEAVKGRWPAFRIDVERLVPENDIVSEALAWAEERVVGGPVILYTSVAPEELERIQGLVGVAEAGAAAENVLAEIASGLVRVGVRRLIVAGGETAGAVVRALHVKALRIGCEIDPGVPWTVTTGKRRLALALKSGNFGSPDFFFKAVETVP
ncbi:four-carbon acid sugar kinase family protein [Candidatus Sumerlaeota bacterium]|nr:four-carbon acid sugar kinase family protein [Candidatus Sumerlaeota bacterium]